MIIWIVINTDSPRRVDPTSKQSEAKWRELQAASFQAQMDVGPVNGFTANKKVIYSTENQRHRSTVLTFIAMIKKAFICFFCK
jgi:hypothetical protein